MRYPSLEALKNNVPQCLALTGRVKDWLNSPESRLSVSCTVMSVEDSMEGQDSIEESWIFTSHGLRNAAGVAIDLSKLRHKDFDNGKGLISSGAVSFARMYSELNGLLRRGGIFRNGAITLYLDHNHPDLLEFLTTPPSQLPWAKRAVYVDSDLENNPLLDLLAEKVNQGQIWLAKKSYDQNNRRLYSNVCLTSDTWVETDKGITQIKDLLDTEFSAFVENEYHQALPPMVVLQDVDTSERLELGRIKTNGFFQTGVEMVYQLDTYEGFSLKLTENHKVLTNKGMVAAKDLKEGDLIKTNNFDTFIWDSNKGSFDEGWLLGQLIGDGTFATDNSARLYFYGDKKLMLTNALEKLQKQEFNVSISTSEKLNRVGVQSKDLATLAKDYQVVKESKTVSEIIEKTSMAFYKGFLQGYFDADGTVNKGTPKGSGRGISLTSISLQNLQRVQRMLLRLGILSRIFKNHQPARQTLMPDGKGGQAYYNSKATHRLDISGQKNIQTFADEIGFSFSLKQEKLTEVLSTYKKEAYTVNEYVKFQSLTPLDLEPVYDCTIDKIHSFSANGLIVSNCLEILLPSRGTCLISNVNLGSFKNIEDIKQGFVDSMEWLCCLHPQTGLDENKEYLSPEKDKQVGLGVIGLANLLAIHKVKYINFVSDLKYILDSGNRLDGSVAQAIYDGFQAAADVAKSYGMERAFTVAPTANTHRNYQDADGFTCSAEISPPLSYIVDRDSGIHGVETYEFHPRTEIAKNVGWNTQWRLLNAWQQLMESTGLAHSISANIWNTQFIDADWILNKFMPSKLVTTYYRLAVEQSALDKSKIVLSEEEKQELREEAERIVNDPNYDEQYCESCGG